MNQFARPMLVPHARYRWDKLRGQHQIVFPEGLLVLNDAAAAVARRCDGRALADLLAAVSQEFEGADVGEDVQLFLERLATRGLLRDGGDHQAPGATG